jgi:hypothetical protein
VCLTKTRPQSYETERHCTCTSPSSSDHSDHSPTSEDSDDVTGHKIVQVYFGCSPGRPSLATEDLLLYYESTQPYFGGPISLPSILTENLHHNTQPRLESPAHHSSLMGDEFLVYSCPYVERFCFFQISNIGESAFTCGITRCFESSSTSTRFEHVAGVCVRR